MIAAAARSVLACVVAGLLLGSTALGARPNLIVMIVDDLGYGDVSRLAKDAVETPNLDRLARMGVTFTSGYVTAPLCAPSRAGFYTGVYPQRFGFLRNEDTLPTDLPLLPGVLREAGYRTGLLGKWHAGGPMPHDRGCFDETLCSPASSPFINFQAPKLARNGVVETFEEYSSDLFAREAEGFIERNKSQPFALTIAFNAPHIGRVVKEAGAIRTAWEAARASGTIMDIPKHPTAPHGAAAAYADRFPGDTARADTVATIAALDTAVGRILDKLRDAGLDRNTVVFFFADNGGHPENRSENGPLRDYKWSHFEGGIRVPFFAAYPGVFPAGLAYDQPVSTLDIFPTMMALAGIEPPARLDGANLTPYLTGEKRTPPHEALYFNTGNQGHGAVRQGKWKLVLDRHEPKLFDLADDLGETNDLANREPDLVESLVGKWRAWKAQMPPSQKADRKDGRGG
jgi:arylsulfatase A-like enzyme